MTAKEIYVAVYIKQTLLHVCKQVLLLKQERPIHKSKFICKLCTSCVAASALHRSCLSRQLLAACLKQCRCHIGMATHGKGSVCLHFSRLIGGFEVDAGSVLSNAVTCVRLHTAVTLQIEPLLFQVREERERALVMLETMSPVVTNAGEAFEQVEAPLARLTAQFTAVERSHKEM